MRQVVHCCNSYLGEGGSIYGGGIRRRAGGRGRLLLQTVARKHLWHLSSLSLKCQGQLTEKWNVSALLQGVMKNVARVSILAAMFIKSYLWSQHKPFLWVWDAGRLPESFSGLPFVWWLPFCPHLSHSVFQDFSFCLMPTHLLALIIPLIFSIL